MTYEIDGSATLNDPAASASPVTVTFDSQLVQNYAAGRAIDGTRNHNLASIQDDQGRPMTFALKADKTLAVVHKQTGPGTGFAERVLTAEGVDVKAFGVGQNPDLQFHVCMAAQDPNDARKVNLYTASKLEPEAFLASDADIWTLQAVLELNPDTEDRVTQVYVGNGNLGDDDVPGIVVTTSENHVAKCYALRLDPPSGDKLVKFNLATEPIEVLDLAIGCMNNGTNPLDGVYLLKQTGGGGKELSFASFPNRRGQSRYKTFRATAGGPTPADFNCLQVLPEDPNRGLSGVYLGGRGLYHLPASRQSMSANEFEYNVVAKAADVPGVSKLALREDNGNVTVWALTSDHTIVNVDGDKPSTFSAETSAMVPATWRAPIALLSNIREWAPIRNKVRQTNDVMVITRDQGNSITRMVQEPATRLWTSSKVPLDDSNLMQHFESYATRLSFRRENGDSVQDLKVQVTASEWCEVYVNGQMIELDDQRPTTLVSDMAGVISVVARPDSISAPILRVHGMDKPVNPGSKVQAKLTGIQSREALLDLVPRNHGRSGAELDAFVHGLGQLTDMQGRLPADGTRSTNYLAGIDPASDSVPAIWGMSIGPAGVSYFHDDEVDVALADQGDRWWERGVVRSAGDVLNWLWNAVRSKLDFVVERIAEAWNMAVRIGTEIFRFTIDCLAQVAKGISWVFEKVFKVGLEALRKFAGFLFDFDAIRSSQKVLSNIASQLFPYGISQVELVKDEVEKQLEELKGQIENLGEFPDGTGTRLLESQRNAGFDQLPPERQKAVSNSRDHALVGFFTDKMQAGGLGGAALAEGMEALQLPPALRTAMNEIAGLLEGARERFARLGGNLQKFFEGRMELQRLALLVGKDVLLGLVEIFESVVRIVAAVLKDLIEFLGDMLTRKVHVPLLTPLYTWFMDTESASILDLLVFPIAASSTTVYKLVTGKAPFHAGTGGLETMGHVEMFKAFEGAGRPGANTAPPTWEQPLRGLMSVATPFIDLIANMTGLASAITGLNKPAVISGGFQVIGILTTIPIGAFHHLEAVVSWAWRSLGVLEVVIGLIPVIGSEVAAVVGDFVNLFGLVPTSVSIGREIIDAAGDPAKIVNQVWGGINSLAGVGIGGMTAVTTCIPKAPPQSLAIKTAVGKITAVGVVITFGSDLLKSATFIALA